MRKILQTICVMAPMLAAIPAHATYETFFGEDLNFSASTPLFVIPNVTSAQAAFSANLVNIGTETLETAAPNESSPTLTLGSVKAAIDGGTGGSNRVSTVMPGETNSGGRYSVPAQTSSNYYEASPYPDFGFSITFDRPVAAFGFVGIDIGEVGGHLRLSFYDAAANLNATFLVPSSVDQTTDGSVLYFGVIANNAGEFFQTVKFELDIGSADSFGFDDFSVGDLRQAVTPANVAEPSSLALLSLALAAAVRIRRRHAN